MSRNTTLCQDKNHQIQMDRAAIALEAKSDEKRVPDRKPVVETKGKKADGIKKLTKSFEEKKKVCSDQEISS